MAVTKLWPVRGNPGSPIKYVEDELKTANPRWGEISLSNLTDVMHYASDEDKTEKQFFVTGVNCNAQIARDQFVTVKKQFGKEDGIVAYHGYQSFAEGEVTPELAHEIGLEFARRLWGDKYQVVVATHLNTNHIHNHFVVNSISFKDGKRLRDKQWYEFRKLSDEICYAHGLGVVEKSRGKGVSRNLYYREQHGASTRVNVARRAVDEAISVSGSIRELEMNLKSMGYYCSFRSDRKYWTIKQKGWKKPIRLARLGDDYTNDRIVERLKEDAESKMFVVYQKAVYVRRQYRIPTRGSKVKKVGGLKGLYLHYCYLLGYLPKYNQNPLRVSPYIRDDLIKMEEIAKETRFICRENLETIADLTAYKEVLLEKVEVLSAERNDIRKTLRTLPEEEQKDAKRKILGINNDIKDIRKELRLCNRIEARSTEIERRIDMIELEEKRRNERYR